MEHSPIIGDFLSSTFSNLPGVVIECLHNEQYKIVTANHRIITRNRVQIKPNPNPVNFEVRKPKASFTRHGAIALDGAGAVKMGCIEVYETIYMSMVPTPMGSVLIAPWRR